MAQPGPMIDLGKNRAEAAQLADVLQTQQMRARIFQQQQQAQQEQEDIKNAFRSNPDDIRAALPAVKKIDPYYGWQVEGQVTAAENAAADLRRKRAAEMSEDQLKKVGVFAGILNAHNNPDDYEDIHASLRGLPGYESFADQLPKTYDKGWMDRKIKEAVPFLEQLKQTQEANKPFNVPENSRAFVPDPAAPGGFREIVGVKEKQDYGVPEGTVAAYREKHGLKPGAPLSQDQALEVRKLYGQSDDRPPVNVYAGPNNSIQGDFSKTGDEFLATVPAQWRKTVEKIARYDEDPTRVASMRGGMRETLMQWVNQANPAYKDDEFKNRAPTRKAFTTGTQGKQITNINTAIGHIDQFGDLAAQLENGGFVPGNEAWNTVRTMFGSEKVSNFDTLKDALAGEVSGVLAQSGATVSGIAAAEKNIHNSASPRALAGYVKTLLPIMGEKLGSMDYTYHQAMGEDDPWSPLSPRAKAILVKNGIDPNKLKGSYVGDTSTTSTQNTAAAPTPALKLELDKQQWADGRGHRVTGAVDPADNGVWKREPNGAYTKVSN